MGVEMKVMTIVSDLSKIPMEELELNSDIFESNIITSLGLLELVSRLEKEFDLVILPEELIHENFGTIEMIINLIGRKAL
ncbi:acyl carrier protein [Clostridium estertheticum]|uniref:acyl carrier protein n=1 Tax=Clostridium estertheticum TaxID=238834 RepID=UPI0013EE695B|nr:acyl carrier protein [Clostridium estertheticum]MBZ9609061.1 acyl carrier protein [Clostridium estertheticum]